MTKKARVSKEEWMFSALEILETNGVDAIRIDDLAARLHISKSGFYWHFKNRNDLLVQILDYWTKEYTEIVTKDFALQSINSAERLKAATEMIWEKDLGRYDLAIRLWGKYDPLARNAVKKVNKLRIDFTKKAFSELGFSGDELEMRANLYFCYVSMEKSVFGSMRKEKWKKLTNRRLKLLTSK